MLSPDKIEHASSAERDGAECFDFSSTNCATAILGQPDAIRGGPNNFCDLALFGGHRRVGATTTIGGIPAHKIILASASEYFLQRLTSLNQTAKELHIDEVDHSVLKYLVDYIYKGNLHAPAAKVPDVLRATQLFKMPVLSVAAEEFIADHLTVPTCIGTHAFAVEHECEVLPSAAVNFIARNLATVLRQDEFIELDADQIIELFKSTCDVRLSPSSRLDDEDVKCEAAVAWLVHPSIDRQPYADRVMQCVDVGRLSARMWRWVKKNDMVMSGFKDSKRKLEPEADVNDDSRVPDKRTRNATANTAAVPSTSPMMTGHMYLLGGCGREATHAFFRFSLTRQRWYELEDELPWRRWAAGACLLDNSIYVAGGCKNPARNSSSSFTNQVDAYNIGTKKWTESIIPSMLEHRGYFAFAGFGDTLYAAGGRGNNDSALSSVEIFQFNQKSVKSENDAEEKPPVKWTAGATLSVPRASPGYAVIGSKLFVVGGSNSELKSDTIEVFDHATASSNAGWTVLSHDECRLTEPRSSPAVASVNDELFVIGGTVDDGLPTRRVEVVNVTEEKRRRISPLSFARRGCTAVSAGPVVYVFGGRDEMGQYLSTMDMYDTRTNQWERDLMSSLPIATAFASAVVVPSVS